MTTYYDIKDKIKEIIEADENINTVTTGSLPEIAMDKMTTYGLAHFSVNNISYGRSLIVSITLFVMDIVYVNKEDEDGFQKNNNLDDVLNSQLAVAVRFLETLRRGHPVEDGYHLNGTPTLTPFTERFEDEVAGWECTFSVEMTNNMTRC